MRVLEFLGIVDDGRTEFPRVNANRQHCRQEAKLRPEGFEPSTYGLEIRCSIQLSYGRKA